MEMLMKALGDDGLDEFDKAQLDLALGGEGDWETDHKGDGDDEASEEDVEGGLSSGEKMDDTHGEDQETDDEEGEKLRPVDGNVEQRDEQDIALDDVESVDDDAVPRQKIEIDNEVALERIRETIQLGPSLPWTETLTLLYPQTINVDVDDDLNRELSFYKQALHSANEARALAAKLKFPFTRPADYFAEMVKSDLHMERIRQRLLDESATIQKSELKRKEREGKKFGKQVQVEKLKEREKSKKDMEEKLKSLKRKRKDVLDNMQGEDDAFDIAVEDAISDRPAKRGRGGGRGITREVRNRKYGFGGAGRRSKQNTEESTDNFGTDSRGGRRGSVRSRRGGARGGMRGRANQRPGKARRIAARSKT
ncbi:eukaryotic rRNA processing [Tricholoma matsutake]|nr:eukaryotic rRNA processing [Tricholoma matsutake 945]